LILEDSADGIQAGIDSGASTVWVRDVGKADPVLAEKCLSAVDSLDDVRPLLTM
jgi:beta-phosphoglucomutase-like phosphatase (HAD superfamily)